MTREEALKILENENIAIYNWFNSHRNEENEVGITREGEIWYVYATSERAAVMGKQAFNNESDALESFIKRVRSDKRLRDEGIL